MSRFFSSRLRYDFNACDNNTIIVFYLLAEITAYQVAIATNRNIDHTLTVDH